jgi:hypothetical protein
MAHNPVYTNQARPLALAGSTRTRTHATLAYDEVWSVSKQLVGASLGDAVQPCIFQGRGGGNLQRMIQASKQFGSIQLESRHE